ncbi:MAG: hypothetical protein WKF35_06440 [Ferruginibacter sp.]
MNKDHFLKSAALMLFIVVVAIISWEWSLRDKGHKISYDDGSALWANKRDKVYNSNTTVFIGSSRIKYDLDTETWKKITGEKPVQLAMEGTNSRPILQQLGNDEKFKGRLIIDVTEGLFFSESPGRQSEVTANLEFYKSNHTPAQKSSFLLNKQLESNLVFLDKDAFSLAALMDKIKLPQRQGVFSMPDFPLEFNRVNADRQSYMTPEFLADSNLQNRVKMIWKNMGGGRREPPPTGDTLLNILSNVKISIDKIKGRGGSVLFVRTPSSGPFLMLEEKGFPRKIYWEQLLKFTNTPGIHFLDYKETAHFQCPEFSHLSKSDAVLYTTHLIKTLATEQHWIFPAIQKSL